MGHPQNFKNLFTVLPLALLLAACQATDNESPEAETVLTSPAQTAAVTRTPRPIAQPRHRPDRPDAEQDAESAESHGNLWDRIADGLALYQQYDHPSIEAELRWYIENASFFNDVSERAAPFLYWIVEEIERRNLPMELALLPIVESGFDATAYSSQRAAGLWQFMSSTASNFGLQRDWWYDGRLDPLQSTVAALDYLQALYDQFDQDWLLAMAAYNVGEGNMKRALARAGNKAADDPFWQLRLPGETRSHIPRILAIAKIFADPGAYGIELPAISNEPYLVVVDPGFQLDLNHAAKAAGLDPAELRALNPGYRQWATHPEGPHRLLIPASQAQLFNEQVSALPPAQRMVWDEYQIQPGDSLSTIATKFGLTVDVLRQANGLQGSRIIAGRSLLIPLHDISDPASVQPAVAAEVPLSSPAPASYRVRPGDSLWQIARRFDLHSTDIAQWNGFEVNSVLRPGQVLILQPNEIIASTGGEESALQRVTHRVRSGESLAVIARRYRVSVNDLLNWNDVDPEAMIHPGQEFVVYVPSRDVN